MREYNYIGNCTNLNGASIEKMQTTARAIKWPTFSKKADLEDIGFENIFPHPKDDYAVTFGTGFFDGIACVFMVHSAIEYVFTK